MTYYIIKTDSNNPDFHLLVAQLDAHFKELNGEKDAFYAQYNQLDTIKNVVIAYDNGTPIGCGAIKKYDGETMEVKRMFVKPEFRRKGVARAVLSELEKWTAELGYSFCILETGKKQPEAISLYMTSGYELIPNYGQYEKVENSVCMRKIVVIKY